MRKRKYLRLEMPPSDQIAGFRTQDMELNAEFKAYLKAQGTGHAHVFKEFMKAFVRHCRARKSLRFPFEVEIIETAPEIPKASSVSNHVKNGKK